MAPQTVPDQSPVLFGIPSNRFRKGLTDWFEYLKARERFPLNAVGQAVGFHSKGDYLALFDGAERFCVRLASEILAGASFRAIGGKEYCPSPVGALANQSPRLSERNKGALGYPHRVRIPLLVGADCAKLAPYP